MIVIYHGRDLDGWASAAIIKHYLVLNNGNMPRWDSKKVGEVINFIPWDYGMPFPDIAKFGKGEPVVMCDISFPMDVMRVINERADGNFQWIDHHASAIKLYADTSAMHGPFLYQLTDTKHAACELTWLYTFGKAPMHTMVRLLGLYDSFRHKGQTPNRSLLKFQYGAGARANDMQSTYKMLFGEGPDYNAEEELGKIMGEGEAIYKFLCTEVASAYKNRFDIKLGSMVFAAVNRERTNPVNFGIDYHKDGYDGFLAFWYKNGKWNFSLYNDDGSIDCAAICATMGGGGHKGAAGFTSDDIYDMLKYRVLPADLSKATWRV